MVSATDDIRATGSSASSVSRSRIANFARASLGVLRPDLPLLTLAVAMALVSGVLQTLLMFVLAMLAYSLSSTRVPDMTPLLPWYLVPPTAWLPATATGIVVANLAILAPLAYCQSLITSRAVGRLRRRLIDGYLRTSLLYRTTQPEGRFQELVGDYCQNATQLVQNFAAFTVGSATLAALLFAPILLHPKVAAVEVAIVVASFVLLGPIMGLLSRDAAKRASIHREIGSASAQLARLSDEIEVFSVGEAVARRIVVQVLQAQNILRRLQFYDLTMPQLYQFGGLALLMGAIGTLTAFYPGRHPSLGVMALISVRVLTYGRQVLFSAQQGAAALPYVRFVQDEAGKFEANAARDQGRRDVHFTGLHLHNAGFSYGQRQILTDANLAVSVGEAVAIIGPSGEGKSTLCSLLMGLRSPTEGAVCTGDVPIDSIHPQHWAGIAAYVPQEPKLLSGTIAENIRFFRDKYDNAAVVEAARAAHIHEEIEAMPDGYDTLVGPGARDLSGGQRQRIVIARALLGRPQLLLLDEPSSSLDADSEKRIGETLAQIKGGTTIILITHRPATIAICDRVLHLQGTRLVEQDPASCR